MNLIKKTILVLSCLIMTACSNQANDATEQAANDVISRFAEQDLNIELCADLPKTVDGCDQFTTSVNNGRLTIHGSSGVALCRGFYDYAKSHDAGISSWSGKRCELPEQLTDTDENHPTLRLERWLDYPHLHANGDAERGERFEHNARRIVTIWGPPVDDYSARIWSGLIRDYYLPRWMFYFDAKLNDKPIDFAEWERQWVEEKTGVSAIERNEDVIILCKETVSYCKNLCDARNRKRYVKHTQ